MNKKVLIPLAVVFFVSAACSFGIGGATETPTLPPPPTQAPVELPTPTQPAPPTAEVVAPTTEPTATEAAEILPTEAPCPAYGFEGFDEASPCWPHTMDEIYSVAPMTDDRKASVDITDGMLEFRYGVGEDIYLYSFNTAYYYEEVILQSSIMKIEPSVNQNGFAFACHVNEEGWYEARIESGGNYRIFQYDAFKKANNENPFVFIAEGGTPAIRVGAGRDNLVRFECLENSLRLVVNGTEVWFDEIRGMRSGGSIGLGLASYSQKYPLHIGFDDIEIIEP